MNVKSADSLQLHQLFGVSLPSGAADSLAAALLDWRDADREPRASGAERDWYPRAHSTPPRDRPIRRFRGAALRWRASTHFRTCGRNRARSPAECGLVAHRRHLGALSGGFSVVRRETGKRAEWGESGENMTKNGVLPSRMAGEGVATDAHRNLFNPRHLAGPCLSIALHMHP